MKIIEKFFIYRIVVLLVRVTRLPFFKADNKSFSVLHRCFGLCTDVLLAQNQQNKTKTYIRACRQSSLPRIS